MGMSGRQQTQAGIGIKTGISPASAALARTKEEGLIWALVDRESSSVYVDTSFRGTISTKSKQKSALFDGAARV